MTNEPLRPGIVVLRRLEQQRPGLSVLVRPEVDPSEAGLAPVVLRMAILELLDSPPGVCRPVEILRGARIADECFGAGLLPGDLREPEYLLPLVENLLVIPGLHRILRLIGVNQHGEFC